MMDDYSPYQSPQPYKSLTPSGYAVKPAVVTWFKVYASVMLVLYLIVAVIGAALLTFSDDLADQETGTAELQLMGAIYSVLGLLLSVGFVIGLVAPRRGWGWVYSIVLICIGLTSCLTIPACIPLLVFWLKPETKNYFGMST